MLCLPRQVQEDTDLKKKRGSAFPSARTSIESRQAAPALAGATGRLAPAPHLPAAKKNPRHPLLLLQPLLMQPQLGERSRRHQP